MFDIGGLELLVVAVILIVVVGPKELPGMLRVFGQTMRKVRRMAADFRGQFDEALREAEFDEVRKTVADVGRLNPRTAMRDAMKPFKDANEQLKRDLDANGTVDLDGPPGLGTGPEMEAKPGLKDAGHDEPGIVPTDAPVTLGDEVVGTGDRSVVGTGDRSTETTRPAP